MTSDLYAEAMEMIGALLVEIEALKETFVPVNLPDDTIKALKEHAALKATLKSAPEAWREVLRNTYAEQRLTVDATDVPYLDVPALQANQGTDELVRRAEALLEDARREALAVGLADWR